MAAIRVRGAGRGGEGEGEEKGRDLGGQGKEEYVRGGRGGVEGDGKGRQGVPCKPGNRGALFGKLKRGGYNMLCRVLDVVRGSNGKRNRGEEDKMQRCDYVSDQSV